MNETGFLDSTGKLIYIGDTVRFISRERTGTHKQGRNSFSIEDNVAITAIVKWGEFTTWLTGTIMSFYLATEQTTEYDSYVMDDKRPQRHVESLTKLLSKELAAKCTVVAKGAGDE